MKENYHKLMEKQIEEIRKEGKDKKLLLHSCCAPCSTYPIDLLKNDFHLTSFFYNPNIFPKEEYDFRKEELKSYLKSVESEKPLSFVDLDHQSRDFYSIAQGLEDGPEGGPRCLKCYRLRLEKTFQYAKEHSYDFVTTSLTISPHKDSQIINLIGKNLSEKYGINYLYSDFKKKNGFLISSQITKEKGMYRQDYCGCQYSIEGK